jgi:predicted nuclease with TOPRIM domain
MIPILDKTIVKIGLTITLIGLLFGFYKWHYNNIYEAGANSVRAELMEQYQEREKELNGKLSDALEKNKKQKEKSSKAQEDLRKKEIENRKLRNEINNAEFKLNALGIKFLNLWNKTIGTKPKLD